ncbi:hypothetical protein [Rubripirellula tenax]|uniref:hypothetical protein n=1 Tax=Rubripirellula tenax TaxID=2528015 RepID=UPI0011B59AC0|nr:hypothetical protein [Rubripirellula tenax]
MTLLLTAFTGCSGDVASNVPSKDFAIRELPDDASDIHFALNPGIRNPNSYFEFTTSETAFLAWAAHQPNVERVDKPQFIIYRYSDYPGETDDRGSIVVDDGYLFEWYNPNDGDHGEHIAYDRSTGRAYYWSHIF